MQQIKSGVVALGLKTGERCQLVVSVSPDLVQKTSRHNADQRGCPFIQAARGKTKPSASWRQRSGRLPKALDKIRHILKKMLKRFLESKSLSSFQKALVQNGSFLVEGLWDVPQSASASLVIKQQGSQYC